MFKDGGAPVETYIIEMKDKFSPLWTKALEVPAGQTAATIAGLTQGEEYQFRVKAKNKAGPGAPSEESDSVVAKPRHCKKLSVNAMQCDGYGFFLFSGSKN